MPRLGFCRQSRMIRSNRSSTGWKGAPIAIIGLLAGPLIGFDGGAAPAFAAQDKSAPTRIDRAGTEDRARRPTVRVEELGAPGAGSVGTLSGANGGLGTDLWRGAAVADVIGEINRLPERNHSHALHDLQRRLLLTTALAPAKGAAPGSAEKNLMQVRLNALANMGAPADVLALAARAKQGHVKPYPVIRAAFLTGKHKQACAAARAVEKPADQPAVGEFIEQALIACHVLDGDPERAEIALRLLHEQGTPPQKTFEAAVLAAVAGEAPGQIGKPYALSVALLRHSKAKLGKLSLEPLPTDVLVALPDLPGLARQLRIKAAEIAAMRGAPVDSDLAILYAGASVSAAAINSAGSIRLRQFDTRARTRLYLAAAGADDVPKRLRVLSAWWRLAAGAARRGSSGAEMLAARQTTPFLKNIEPAATYQDHAAHIARAYFATGRVEAALSWYRLLKNAPFRNPADLHRISAPAVLAGPTNVEAVEAWMAYKRQREPKAAARHIADLKALLDGLGRMQAFGRLWSRQDASARGGDAGETPTTRSGSYGQLRAAAATGKRGMTVLHVLRLIAGRSLNDVPRDLLRESVASLRAVGLTREATQLAVEAALLRRL